MRFKTYGHRFNDPLNPLSSQGRILASRIYSLMKDENLRKDMLYGWVDLDNLVPNLCGISKFLPPRVSASVTLHGGDLLFKFSFQKDGVTKFVYFTKKEIRNMNFSYSKFL